jgi:hypothetical protein
MTDPAAERFVTDRELHQLIGRNLGWDRFRATVRNAETQGFPKIHSVWGGRYWPAVAAWLDSHYGLVAHDSPSDVEDGPEHFDATPRQSARAQDRPHAPGRHPPAVLVRPQRGA